MLNNRFAAKVFLGVILAVLAGCAAVSVAHSAVLPVSAVTAPGDLKQAVKFVYVADSKLDELLVYPYETEPSRPVRVVPIVGAPAGVATDSNGNVYVAVPSQNVVEEFTSGGLAPVQTISHGLTNPMGVAVDSSNDVFVTSAGAAPNAPAFVAKFTPANFAAPVSVMTLPNELGAAGVDVDPAGDVWVTGYGGGGGWALRYANGQWDGTKYALASADGIAVSLLGTVFAASATMVVTFTPPTQGSKLFEQFGVGQVVRMIGKGPDGSMLFPIEGDANATSTRVPSVVVYNPQTDTLYRITNGLKSPYGAAAGI